LAASLAGQLEHNAEMLAYAKRAVEINPWRAECNQTLADAYGRANEWEKAATASRAAVQLNPVSLPARQFLIRIYLKMGDQIRARAELEACLVLLPTSRREDLRQWFSRQLAGDKGP
jgi:tetratricopeptide (TPR) repeat protein